ncbi:MAG: amidohydrolase family protein [Halobacteriales archaeon]
MSIRDTVEATPLVDNHAHAIYPLPADVTPETFAGYFTEGPGSAHARHTINYRVGLDLLAERFDGQSEPELIAQRTEVDLESYSKELLAAANISHICQDTGLPKGIGPDDFAAYTDATIRPMLRIENVAEELIETTTTFVGFESEFQDRLEAALRGDHVALKSIIAYRTGLDVGDPPRSEAAKAFVEESEGWDGRLDNPVLLDYCANVGARIAAEYGAPMQFHSGFGDPDAHPIFVDPGHLYDFLQRHDETDVVLLHAGYPYTRKAAYITSVLENAYLDLGMTIPFVQHGVASLLRRTLELAPTTKLLYSSDGFGIPEWYYLAAERIRTDLTTVLEGLVADGFLNEAYAEEVGMNILRENAVELYDLATG